MLLHRYCNLTEWMHNLLVREGSRKNSYLTPSNLTIVTAHNYQTKPLFEVNNIGNPKSISIGYFIQVLEKIKGTKMIDWKYEGPFDELEAQSKLGGYPFVNAKLKAGRETGISCHRSFRGNSIIP